MDDEFDDDDSFAALPDDTLYQLEQNAISSTQRQTTSNAVAAQPTARNRSYGTNGLARNNAPNKSNWRAPRPRPRPPSKPAPQVHTAPPASAPAPPSSDYGFDDEDVIDLDEPSMVVQSTSALPTRARTIEPSSRAPQQQQPRYASKPPLDPETQAAFAAADAELNTHQARWNQAPHLQPAPAPQTATTDTAALQSRINALLAEQTRLQQSETAARNAAQAKAGEIAIVRANHEKASKEYERRIAVMQKLHGEEAVKLKGEVEMGRKERERLETDRRFLQHDFDQARAAKVGEAGGSGMNGVNGGRNGVAVGAGTPKRMEKRKKSSGLGDGFDDGEVAVVSPSKSRDRSERAREKDRERGEQTPKVGNKRKRAVGVDSPVPALSFEGPMQPHREESQGSTAETMVVKDGGWQRQQEDNRFDFIQKLLHHCPYETQERSIELLTKHFLPSNTTRSLSTLLLDGLYARTLPPSEDEPLPLKLSRVSLRLWSQCLQESFYAPIYLLLDLIRFALTLERAATIVQLIPQAVPVCIRTIEAIASPNARASLYPSFASSAEYQRIQDEIGQHIDVDEVLDFLQLLCDKASLSEETCETFWHHIEFPFMLLMLNKAQPIAQITTALRILATSTLPTTFGAIYKPAITDEDVEKQPKQERDTIDRLVNLLLETPIAPADEPAYSVEELQELRIEILAVLKALCGNEHGTALLSGHRTAVGRLVRFLDAQVTRLYSTRPSVGLHSSSQAPAAAGDAALEIDSDEEGQPHPLHDLITSTINTTTRILYHLLIPSPSLPSDPSTTSAPPISLLEKLSVTRGGYHKFLISFTRLAFSDQLVLEHGIEDQVVEAAHRVLDEVLSPEEGEMVMRGFETPGVTGMGAGVKSWEATDKGTSVGSEEDGGEGEGEGEGMDGVEEVGDGDGDG